MASQATRPEEFEISTTRVADGSRGETVCTWRQWGTLAASLHLGLPDQHMCAPPRRTASVGGGSRTQLKGNIVKYQVSFGIRGLN